MGTSHVAAEMTLALIHVSGVTGTIFSFAAAVAYWRYGERLMSFSLGDTARAKEFAQRWANRPIGYRTVGTAVLVLSGVSCLLGVVRG